MSKPTILIVIPTYGQFDYAAQAARSALENTKTVDATVLVIDDASPERLARDIHHSDTPYGQYLHSLRELPFLYGKDRVVQMQYDVNGGLTRSWNAGLVHARAGGFDCCCVTNSDVVFAPRWDTDVFFALNSNKYQLVGPITNAPGTNIEQYVGRYSNNYNCKKGDDPDHICDVQSELYAAQALRFKETTLNGFCMVALTKTWWDHAYSSTDVFCPRNDFNSRGQPNPTPLMTLNEYELQRRWHAAGLKSAACLGSYVFHYRAVTRGKKHLSGDWTRKKEAFQ